MAEKIRVHNLAKELNVTSKAILAKCGAEGIEVKNHMSTLTAGLEATIREWFSEGAHSTVVEKAERIDLKRERSKARTRKRKTVQKKEAEEPVATEVAETTAAKADTMKITIAAESDQGTRTAVLEAPPVAAPEPVAAEPATTEISEDAVPETTETETDTAAAAAAEAPTEVEAEAPEQDSEEEVESMEATDVPTPPDVIKPAGPQNVPEPAKLKGPRVVRYEAPEEYALPRRGPRRRAEQLEGPDSASIPGTDTSGKPGRGRRRVAAETDRFGRRASARRSGKVVEKAVEAINEYNDQDMVERRARIRSATGRRIGAHRASERGRSGGAIPMVPITTAQVTEPIILKEFCAAIGEPFQRILPVLTQEHGMVLNINSEVSKAVAELVALHFGVELNVVEAKTKLDQLREEFKELERTKLCTRPPIVAVLGHVDHGKTSLLDRIRHSRVAAKEDGGITQHISSYHLKKGNVAVTFVDTPGHEAFTALRARGAKLTDVVVLVIAADDGVMPQTVEAINHAKAAQVPIVVALNKIDLGTQNLQKIYGQLAEHGLTPSGDWGGETDVIQTSATKGTGIDELLEHLSALADVHEFKADPTVPAMGTVVEAQSKRGVGAVVQVIIREGTLSVGDVVVCGNSFGKVRAIVDDTGKRLKQAGPSMPVEVWGMNEVPLAGDDLFKLDSMQRAKEIAEDIKSHRTSESRAGIHKARSIEDLLKQRSDADIPELNVIVKADVDGSSDALTSVLHKFPSDQAKLNILHAAVGAVTDSDVHLADASEAIIIAFRVTAPAETRRLAERQRVEIRHYKVIYDVTDDIKKAMEGLLEPEEVLEQRGTAEVRELFRVSKVGLIAGSYVRDGVIANSHMARVVRDGVVVRDRCKFSSLRRFKDDAKEVRNGMECGIRLEGFDDIKIGDLIESFEVKKIARTLD